MSAENMNNNEKVKELDGEPRRLILWCLPRSGSTALAKCLSFVDEDTEVWFEPFNLCRLTSIHVKRDVGQSLPKDFTGNEALFNMVVAGMKEKMKIPIPRTDPYLLSYEGVQKSLEGSKRRTVIVKEMGVASYDSYDYIPKGYRHIIFIRDPTRVITSFRKMVMEPRGKEFENADLEKVHPTYPDHHWFGEIHALWKHLTERLGASPLVIDTEDFMADPASFLKKICEVAEIEYRDGLLQWDASKDVIETWRNGCVDGFANEKTAQSQVFKRAFESSSFGQPTPKPPPEKLTEDCVRIIGQCVDFYNEMYASRFIPEQK